MRCAVLILLFALVLDAAATAPSGTFANDQGRIMSRCQLLLLGRSVERTAWAADANVIFDAGRAAEMLSLAKELKRRLETGVSTAAPEYTVPSGRMIRLLYEYPRMSVAENGDVFVVERGEDDLRLRVLDPDSGQTTRRTSIAGDAWLGALGRPSPGGRFVVTQADGQRRVRILSAETGAPSGLNLDSAAGEESSGVTFEFTPDDRYLVVNRAGRIEIFGARGNAFDRFATYRLGSNVEWLHAPVPMYVIGAVHYLPERASLAAFYLDAEPLILKLNARGHCERRFLAKPTIAFPSFEAKGDLAVVAEHLAKPNYHATGYVSPAGDRIFATRVQVGPGHELSAVDVWSTDDRRYLGSVAVPWLITRLAISPDGNWFAVAHRRGVLVFDLRRSKVKPVAQYTVELGEAALLAFPRADLVVAGSINLGRVYRFNLKDE